VDGPMKDKLNEMYLAIQKNKDIPISTRLKQADALLSEYAKKMTLKPKNDQVKRKLRREPENETLTRTKKKPKPLSDVPHVQPKPSLGNESVEQLSSNKTTAAPKPKPDAEPKAKPKPKSKLHMSTEDKPQPTQKQIKENREKMEQQMKEHTKKSKETQEKLMLASEKLIKENKEMMRQHSKYKNVKHFRAVVLDNQKYIYSQGDIGGSKTDIEKEFYKEADFKEYLKVEHEQLKNIFEEQEELSSKGKEVAKNRKQTEDTYNRIKKFYQINAEEFPVEKQGFRDRYLKKRDELQLKYIPQIQTTRDRADFAGLYRELVEWMTKEEEKLKKLHSKKK